MRKVINTIMLSMAVFLCHAQLYDNEWVAGDVPLSFINVGSDTVSIDSINNNQLSFTLTIANICDENGNLLYITNGVAIYDKNGDTIQNGTGISPCAYTTENECCGLNILQATLFIPQPGNERYYYLFHFSNDDTINGGPENMYYSLIDKEGNGGLGAVIEKNVSILHNTLLREGGMAACKHANGRDYWLTIGGSVVSTFYKFLITPNGIQGPYIQSIGPEFPLPFDNAYSRFSQDGSKFVTGVYEGPVLVMDFDRCSGEFSNPVTIYNQGCDSPQSCSASVSVEISANNRFVYVSDVINLTQYDLWASNIQDSVQIFAIDTSQIAELNMMMLAPNGKIYINSWNGTYSYDSLHVVNEPNAIGDSCNFIYAGQPTYSHGNAVPNMANYRLGPLVGSGCDTLPTAINSLPTVDDNAIRVYPNPASTCTVIDYGFNDWGKAQPTLQICNALGQLVFTKALPLYSGLQQIDVSNFTSGLYTVFIKRGNGIVATGKLVVVH